MDGEGVEARLLNDKILAVGVAVGAGLLSVGEEGCAGVAWSCVEQRLLTAVGMIAVLTPLRVHLLHVVK